MHPKRSYIVITGGVLSGLGKGVVTASIGKLLQFQGLSVTAIKIDPYINIDAGTMRPTEHGEVFVTADGGEIDQDLGNYERFLGEDFTKDHNITTGQVYLNVIQKERAGEYLGEDVEVIPHIPEEIIRRIRATGERTKVDVVLIEVGGTVGDYQNVLYLEAVREMKLQGDNVLFVHVVYLPIPKNIGEMKTKPAQHSIRQLNSLGIQADYVIGRAEKPLDERRKKTISFICSIPQDSIYSAPDLETIYEEPLVLANQGIDRNIIQRLGFKYKNNGKLKQWKRFVDRITNVKKEVNIGIVGKYFDHGDFSLEDSYISVIEAVKHAAFALDRKPILAWINSKDFERGTPVSSLSQYDGIIVPGGFGSSGVEGKIRAIRHCRENKIPYLGLCLGLQLAVVEYSRNVCSMDNANTTEIDPKTPYPVVDILPEQVENITGMKYGGTMRLGAWPAMLKKGSKVHKLYGTDKAVERHRHRYEVNPKYIKQIESYGLVFSGTSPDRNLMEYIELPKHPFFVATQAHPEFTSRPLEPNPLFYGFVKSAIRNLY